MGNPEEMLQYLISIGEITQERFDELVAAKQKELGENPPSFVADVKAKSEELDERTLGMQEIDFFTLDETGRLDERTKGMQDIDQFSMDMIFDLQAQLEELKNRVEILEGGN